MRGGPFMIRHRAVSLCLMVFCLQAGSSAQVTERVEVWERVFSRDLATSDMVILTRHDLETFDVSTLTDLFAFCAGVGVARRGPGSFDITMGGGNFQQVLVMVNGVPVSNPQTGHFNTLLPFSLADVERVEVIRGAAAGMYGGGGSTGAINIILNRKRRGGAIETTGGENGTLATRLVYDGAAGQWHGGVSLEQARSSGYYSGREFDRWIAAVRVLREAENHETGLLAGYRFDGVGADGFYGDYPSVEEIDSLFIQASHRMGFEGGRLLFNTAYRRVGDDFVLDRRRPDFFRNRSDTDQGFFDVSFLRRWSGFRFEGGLNLRLEGMASSAMGDHGRSGTGLVLSGGMDLPRGALEAGLRVEWWSGDGPQPGVFLGWRHGLGRLLWLGLSAGRTFRPPSFTELFYASPANMGDPDLSAESAWHVDVSLARSRGQTAWRINGTLRRQDGLIDWIRDSSDAGDAEAPWRAANLDPHTVAGLQAAVEGSAGAVHWQLALETLRILSEPTGIESKYGLRFPDLTLRTRLSWRPARGFGLSARHEYKTIHRTEEAGHFLDLVASLRLQCLELRLRMDNVFGTVIEEIPGVPVSGRWLRFEIRLLL